MVTKQQFGYGVCAVALVVFSVAGTLSNPEAIGAVVGGIWGLSLAFLHQKLPGRRLRNRVFEVVLTPLDWIGAAPHIIGEPIGRKITGLWRREA